MNKTSQQPPQAALIHLDIEFDGSPKSLAQIATILDKIHIKIVTAFSHRSLKGNRTRLGIVADTRLSPYGSRELQTTLLQLPEIHTVTIATNISDRYTYTRPPVTKPPLPT